VKDKKGRTIDYLRISLTDRCNLRCIYCMPEGSVEHITQEELLSYEEIERIAKATSVLGVKKIRLTGGEPLVRNNIESLIRSLKAIPGVEEVSITTNGVLLSKMIDGLVEAGLDRINLSIDSLKDDKFKIITRGAQLADIFDGMHKALNHGLKVKINVVLIKGVNEDEALDFVELIKDHPVDVRFIELMPIGEGTRYVGINNSELIDKIRTAGYPLQEIEYLLGSGPARYFELNDAKGDLGFISPMSHQFCETCNRVRLTPEGYLKLCLHSGHGVDLRAELRKGASDESLTQIIEEAIVCKPSAHQFSEFSSEKDHRSMNQIGG